MAHQTHDFVLDDNLRLTTSITATTVAVNGTLANIDLGASPPAFNVNTTSAQAYARCAVLVEWSSLDVASANESYVVELQGANTTDFTTPYRLGLLQLGHSSTTGSATSTPPNGREVFFCDNVALVDAGGAHITQTMRYVRLRVTPAGTTPSITITGAWLLPA
jgi:hypothetical protein